MRHFVMPQKTIFGVVIMISIFGFAAQAMGQTFFEPPSAPPGGNTASWITTSAQTERKLGSLRLGTNTSPVSVCLNAASATDAARCVSSWSQVINLSGGPFVALRTTGLALADQSDPTKYFITPAAHSGDLGSVTIQGSGSTQAISLIAEANSGIGSGAYGLFASDGGNTNSYAAYFDGKVGIERTVLAGGTPGPIGQVCLNSTAAYVSGGAAGCITSWGQLVGGLQNYVRLQAVSPATADTGTAGISEVGNFGTVVVGDAPTGLPALTFCGDGQCSAHLNEQTSGDANYCPIDCVSPLPPVTLADYTPLSNSNRLRIRGQAQTPSGNFYLLLVRSSNPSFITDVKTEFVPQNGVSYTAGSVVNSVTIVAVRLTNGTNDILVTDSGLETDVTYYYRLYQANLFPIYNQTPLVLPMATSSECPADLPPNQACA